jgi:mRNA interferase ChpB
MTSGRLVQIDDDNDRPDPQNMDGRNVVRLPAVTQGGNYARSQSFAVSLSGARTNAQGVILCNQPRTLDVAARGDRFSQKAPEYPEYIVDEVMAKLQPCSIDLLVI